MAYVLLDGSANTWIDTPDSAVFVISGDIDVKMLVAVPDWTPTTLLRLINQRSGTTNRAWSFYLGTSGKLGWNWSTDGTGATGGFQESTTAVGATDGTHRWLRVTMDVDNGAGSKVITFYTSSDAISTAVSSVTWTQLSQHTVAGTTSLFNSTANMEIGGIDGGGSNIGKVYYAEVRNGIAGTIVTSPDFRDFDEQTGAKELTDPNSRVWTIRGNGTWVAENNASPAVIGLSVNLPTPTAGSAATVTPAAITPTVSLPSPAFTGSPGAAYVALTTTTGTWIDTPDHAGFAIAGDIDIRMLVALDDWTPASTQRLIAQRSGATNRAWDLSVASGGTLGLTWSPDGTGGGGGFQASLPAGGVDGSHLWVRATLDVDNGAGSKVVTFYTSTQATTTAAASVTWNQLSTHTIAGTTSLFNSTALPTIGNIDGGNGQVSGKVYYAEIRNGIGGTLVTHPDFRDASQKTTDTTFTDPTGKVWTLRGSATWVSSGTGGTALLVTWRPFDVEQFWHRDSVTQSFVIELNPFDIVTDKGGGTVTTTAGSVVIPWRVFDFTVDGDKWTVTAVITTGPPSPPPTPPVITTEDILTSATLQIEVGLELLDVNDVVLADISEDLETGQLTRNMNADIHGIARFRIARTVNWHNQRLRPYMIITETVSGVFERFNLGIYLPETPSRRTGEVPATFDVEAYDKLVILNHPHGIAVTVEAGTNVVSAVTGLLTGLGLPNAVDPSSSATMPTARSWPLDQRNTTLQICNDLLEAISYRALYVDRNGIFRSEPYRSPEERAPIWHYDATTSDTIIGEQMTEEVDLFNIPNRWVFIRDDPAQAAPVEGNGIYTVTNSTDGPTSISGRGRVISKVVRLDAADQASLVAQGDQQVQRDRQPYAHVEFTAVPNPLHWHAEAVTLTSPDLGLARVVFGEQGWTLPLDGGDMTHKVRRAVKV